MAITSDMPGSTAMSFLGRTVLVPSGVARLSLASGAAIVLASAVHAGRVQSYHLQEPLLPDDHAADDHAVLLQAVFTRHEPAVLAWPEAAERPRAHWRLMTP